MRDNHAKGLPVFAIVESNVLLVNMPSLADELITKMNTFKAGCYEAHRFYCIITAYVR